MDLIQQIRREGFGLDLPEQNQEASRALTYLRRNLANTTLSLSDELYSKTTHFVLELIQNADDNTYARGVIPTLVMEMKGSRLYVRCNEVGFTEEDVRALCSMGESKKRDRSRYIGEKGIGFKSVFVVADVVHVSSGLYTFKFVKNGSLGTMVPIWDPQAPSQEGWTTITLDLSSSPQDQRQMELITHLADLQPSLLLFLRRLRRLELIIDGKASCLEKTVRTPFVQLRRSVGAAPTATANYLCFDHVVNSDAREPKRAGITQTDVIMAYPVTELEEPIPSEQDVYAFLPLKSYGLPFIVHADFITASNREEILTDRQWNRVLRNNIPAVIVQDIREMQKRPSLTYTWFRFIPSTVQGNFFKLLNEKLLTQLGNQPVMLCGDHKQRYPREMIISLQAYQDNEGSAPLIPSKYIAPKFYLAPEYDVTDPTIFVAMGVELMTPDTFLNGLAAMAQDKSLFEQKEDWWEMVARVLHEQCCFPDYRDAIRRLPLAPLTTGGWISVMESGIYFDSALDDVPQDLDLKLVRPLDAHSTHRRLLEDLGVREADSTEVAKRISALHTGSATELNAKTVPSHARFLFKHSSEVSASGLTIRLKVLTKQNKVVLADAVYMDHYTHVSPVLSSCLALPHCAAQFLHADYYNLPWPHSEEELRTWHNWLHEKLHVHIAPKILDNSPSPELSRYLSNSKPADFLAFLKEYTPDMIPRLRLCAKALDKLKETPVIASDGKQWQLKQTYLARGSLAQHTHLPFLPVQDPEDPTWDFLREYGVCLQVDGMLYLDELRRFKAEHSVLTQDASDVVIDQVKAYYKQLDARGPSENLSDTIRDAFRSENLLLLPVDPGIRDRVIWSNGLDLVWEGPPSMRSSSTLHKIYPEFESFLCDQLQIPRWHQDVILREVRYLLRQSANKPLDASQHVHIHEILADLEHMLEEHPEWTSSVPVWVEQLKSLPFIPVETAPHVAELKTLQHQVYLPDLRGHLAGLFVGKVPLVSRPPPESGSTLQSLHRLFHSPLFSSVKSLEDAVQRRLESNESGPREYNAEFSNRFRSKVLYLYRMTELMIDRDRATILQDFAAALENVQIFQIRSPLVDHVYTLGTVSCRVALPLGVEITDNRCLALIGQACPLSQGDGILCLELSNLCSAVSPTELLSIFTQPPFILDMLFPRTNASFESRFLREGSHSPDVGRHPQFLPNGSPPGPPFAHPDYRTDIPSNPYFPDVETLHRLLAEDVPNLCQAIMNLPLLSPFHSLRGLPPITPNHTGNGTGNVPPGMNAQQYHNGYSGSSVPFDPAALNTPWDANVPPGAFPGEFAYPSPPISVSTPEQSYAGLLGEIATFRFLMDRLRLPRFDSNNWTSKLRSSANFGFPEFYGTSVADFEYEDYEGVLTEYFYGPNEKAHWYGRWPKYYLEVKASNGPLGEPFHISAPQLSASLEMSATSQNMLNLRQRDPSAAPPAVYAIVRVWNLGARPFNPILDIYPDPWQLLRSGQIAFVSDAEMALIVPYRAYPEAPPPLLPAITPALGSHPNAAPQWPPYFADTQPSTNSVLTMVPPQVQQASVMPSAPLFPHVQLQGQAAPAVPFSPPGLGRTNIWTAPGTSPTFLPSPPDTIPSPPQGYAPPSHYQSFSTCHDAP